MGLPLPTLILSELITITVTVTDPDFNSGSEKGFFSGKKKAHKHKLFCPVGLRISPDLSQWQTGVVPGTNPVKNWDTPGFSPYFTQWKPDFTGFVPGDTPVCPSLAGTIPGTKGGTESLCGRSLRAFFARYFWKRGLFQKSPFSRDSREFTPDCGKERRFRPLPRDSREFWDLEILEISPVKRPLSQWPLFQVSINSSELD